MIAEINPKIAADFLIQKGEIHAFLNPYTYLQLRKQPEILNSFDTIHFDGIALCKIYDWLGVKTVPRRSFDMTSIAKVVFRDANRTGKTIAIIGTEAGVIDEAVGKLVEEFEVNVVLSRHGFFESKQDINQFQDELTDLAPDIVIVGMGAIRQEIFLSQLKEKGWNGTGFTCGGFLHQTADSLEYYPEIFNRLNLRWLYRIAKDPYVFKRYCLDYPKFLVYFMEDYKRWRAARSISIHDLTKQDSTQVHTETEAAPPLTSTTPK